MTKKKVCIIGLGYVGLPMAIALANVKKNNKFLYEVYGHDNDKKKLKNLSIAIKKKRLPFDTLDKTLSQKFAYSSLKNKINILKNLEHLTKIDIVILSVSFDFINNKNAFKNLKGLIQQISKFIKKRSLLLIETTLPPGTYERVLIPEIKKIFLKRKASMKHLALGYSYERIMPGKKYFNSIINNFRCYSGYDKIAKKKVQIFLKSFMNFKKFPLYELNSITECETAKILENSFRATNIALIDEWVNFANLLKIDLLNVINAIKLRTTHSNIEPGLGVGGYCLPKDGLFAEKSSRLIFKKNINFPFIKLASKINKEMPRSSFQIVENNIGNLKSKNILIVGKSYKEDIDDQRNSPSIYLKKMLKNKVYIISTYDPMIDSSDMHKFSKFDIVIFCRS